MKKVLLWLLLFFSLFIFLRAIGFYSPDSTQAQTDTPEQSAEDAKKPISETSVYDCLSNSGGVITPDSEHLYSLNKMTVFQSLPDGVLMRAAQSLNERLHALEEIAFLKTDRDFADGAILTGYLAAYIGTYEYDTKGGSHKKVLAFRLINKLTHYK